MKTKLKKHLGKIGKLHLEMKQLVPSLILFLFGLAVYSVSHAGSERLTDLAALNIQEHSINKLEKMLKTYKGTEREPEFLSRLGDLYLERSGITFRVSEGVKEAQATKKKSSLYTSSLKESVRVLSLLITKYPNHTDVPEAYFKRGKAYKELGDIAHSKADYIHLFNDEKDFEMLDSAIIDLAEYCADANLHQEALTYLNYLMTELKGSDYYPIGLHKAAWSHYNLANHAKSIELLKTEIEFYFARMDVDSKADMPFLEGAFNDLALFYFEAINKKSEFASVEKALKLFKSLDQSKKLFPQTTFKFAKLLKAYDLMGDLNALKDKMIKDEIGMTETTEVALMIFQYQFDKRNFKGMDPLLENLKEIRQTSKNPEQKKRIEQTMSAALAEMHKMVLKNKASTEVSKLMNPLISLTQSVNEILGQENSTAILSTYALGETAFAIQNYKLATQKYGELLSMNAASTLEANKLNLENIALRQISSRYQELKNLKLVPETLQIHIYKDAYAKSNANEKNADQMMSDWITWVDQRSKKLLKATSEDDKQSYLTFSLEAAKLIYEYQDRVAAMNRLTVYSITQPTTQEGVTAASIVLDTLLKNQDWPQLYEISKRFLETKNWKDKAFAQKTQEINADSHFRITLQTTDPKALQARTKECKTMFKGTAIATECAMIEAKTDLGLGNYEDAELALNGLMKVVKEPAKVQSVLLMRVEASNHLGKFDQAINDLNQYQSMTDYKDSEITQSILQHYWFKRKFKELDAVTQNKKVCSGKTSEICERFRVIRILGQKSKFSEKEIYRNAVHGPKSLAAVWVLVALDDPKKIPFQDRLVYLQRLSSTWDELNPFVQIQLLTVMQERVKLTLESVRIAAPGIAPLTADEATIERRMRLTKDVDTTFAKAMKLPWIDVKIKGAEELTLFYSKLLLDLRGINTPEKLLTPFIQKVEETKQAVVQLTEMQKEFNPDAIPTVVAATSDKKVNRKIASVSNSKPQSVESFLTSNQFKKIIPATFQNEWSQGVKENRSDYLFYLVSMMEHSNSEIKTVSPILKGMILLMSNAPTEAYELIKSADDQPLKTEMLTKFESKRNS